MSDTMFREQCRALCDRHPDLPRLKNIAAVGAYDGVIGGYGNDSFKLTKIAEYLQKSGFLFDPEFEIDVINFREGRDFLLEDKKADFVYVAYILRGRHGCDLFWGLEELQRSPEWLVNLNHTISRRHTAYDWQDRIMSAGTKMVVTFGGQYELGADIFAGPQSETGHTILVPSPRGECMGGYHGTLTENYPGQPGIDLPMAWLGVTADPDYLKAAAPALTRETWLGRESRRQATQNPAPAKPQGLNSWHLR